jgi:hypothetical protein
MGLHCRPTCRALVWHSAANSVARQMERVSEAGTCAIRILIRCFNIRNVWFCLFCDRSPSGREVSAGTLEFGAGSRAPQLWSAFAAHIRDVDVCGGTDRLANGAVPEHQSSALSGFRSCRDMAVLVRSLNAGSLSSGADVIRRSACGIFGAPQASK